MSSEVEGEGLPVGVKKGDIVSKIQDFIVALISEETFPVGLRC